MKKLIFLILISLTILQVSAIIVETGSISGFIYRNEPSAQYDNWLSHVSEGIASANYNLYAPYDRQTNGFGYFRIASTSELNNWTAIVDLFVAGDYDGAEFAIASAGFPYQVVQFNDTDTGRTYYMLRENLDMSYYDDNGTVDPYDDEVGSFAYGWGLYIMNPSATRPVVITVPHPNDDFSTAPLSIEAFKLWDAKYILISGAGREVRWTNIPPFTNAKSLSDPTRVEAHPYNKAYQAFSNDIRSQWNIREFSTQFHSYDWNRHEGMANLQISAGYQKYCPNLPIRDLSRFKRDLINLGDHLMIPANTYGIHTDVYHRDYYSAFYSVHDFTFSDGVNEYPVFDQITLPAYSLNRQMLYTLSGYTDYDTYDPFFHIEMDELPNSYDHTVATYHWFYGYDEATQKWDYSRTHDIYIEYYWRWVSDLNIIMDEMFEMNDGFSPQDPTNLVLTSPGYTSATLSWNRSDDYDFETYEILYATEPIGDANFQVFSRNNNALLASPHTQSIAVTGLNNAQSYYFAIRAKDKNGNYSSLSNEVTTSLAPANVYNFAAYGMHNSVRLSWSASSQTANLGYKIYRRASAGWEMVDSYLTNPALNNSSSSYEWWDNAVVNNEVYTYKISTTNSSQVEYVHNFPMTAIPSDIHTITVSNGLGTITDSISFGINPYASDGQDTYWDVSKGTPSGSNYVWNAFWQQYWGNNGTHLSREIKGSYDVDENLKTWVMRVRSDQLSQNLYIVASDTFGRGEKLYIQDGSTWHDLSMGAYTFQVTNTNNRTMNLHWGNLQPSVNIASQPNRVYQGGNQANFSWSYTYPFLVDSAHIWIVGASDSTLIAENLSSTNTSTAYTIPAQADNQECKLVIYLLATDGVVRRYESAYTFALVPTMSFYYVEPGWKTVASPWPDALLNIMEVYGMGSNALYLESGSLLEATDFLFGESYWVHNPEINFFSSTSPVLRDEISLNVSQGWNFVPNPHLCTYNIKDFRFIRGTNFFTMAEMVAQELISPVVYVSRNGSYQATDRVEPYESFFIKYYAIDELETQINFLPFNRNYSIDPIESRWEFSLSASDSNGNSDSIVVGVNDRSSDDYDFRYDIGKPRIMPEDRIYIHLERTAEEDTSFRETYLQTDFVSDFSSSEELMKTWNFKLWASNDQPISFDMSYLNVPENWTVAVYLNDEGFYSYNGNQFSYTPEVAGWISGVITIRNHYLSNENSTVALVSGLKNYPNPFNPSTTINFSLANSAETKIGIYNIRGQLVKTLHDGPLAAGNQMILWSGYDNRGSSVASGIYFVRISSGRTRLSHKMILIK